MFTNVLQEITIWFGDHGYWGVFLACLGLFPAEIVITMVGAVKSSNLFEIALVAALGETVGAIPTYLIGYYFRNKDILKFLKGKGKFLKISEGSYKNGYESVKREGSIYIFLSRFIPWLRVVTAVVAGYMKYPLLNFSIAVFFGTFIYAYIFAYIGSEIGFNWDEITRIIDTFSNSMLILSILGISIYLFIHRKKYFGKFL